MRGLDFLIHFIFLTGSLEARRRVARERAIFFNFFFLISFLLAGWRRGGGLRERGLVFGLAW